MHTCKNDRNERAVTRPEAATGDESGSLAPFVSCPYASTVHLDKESVCHVKLCRGLGMSSAARGNDNGTFPDAVRSPVP